MDTQTLLTIAAVVGPLAGVALGAILASRFQQSHWFRDRRLDAFSAAQTAVFRVMSTAPYAVLESDPQRRLDALTGLDAAFTQWVDARGRLDILAGASVVSVSDEINKNLNDIILAAAKHVREAVKAAREEEAMVVADRSDWDKQLEAAKVLRQRLTDAMRKELATR